MEILDYLHATGHIWDSAPILIDRSAIDIHAWAEPLCTAARPQSQQARETLRQAQAYFAEHAAAGCMDYPSFMAKGWPIASGLVEAACKSVVCQHTKGSGMLWRRLGAQVWVTGF